MRGGLSNEPGEWYIGPYTFNSNMDRSLYLIEKMSIPTPLSHAGRTEGFFNHAWVRIVWRDMIIDVDPTWYDTGMPLEFGAIAEIIPNRENTFPAALSGFGQLSNTRLISPMTGILQSGYSYTFVISSTDYSVFAIIINDEWNKFTKNNETGNHELNFEIPRGVDTVSIFGVTITGNHWSGTGLIRYNVVN